LPLATTLNQRKFKILELMRKYDAQVHSLILNLPTFQFCYPSTCILTASAFHSF
jgi:hypothetical protein